MPVSDALFSSNQMNWQTPPEILTVIREVCGPIFLDPCTSPDNPVDAVTFYTEEDDGLAQDWPEGLAFINPPYGRAIGDWTRKAAQRAFDVARTDHWRMGASLVLVPARTDTRWWHESRAHYTLFLKGRVKFINPDTGQAEMSAPFPSALLCHAINYRDVCALAERLGAQIMEDHEWAARLQREVCRRLMADIDNTPPILVSGAAIAAAGRIS